MDPATSSTEASATTVLGQMLNEIQKSRKRTAATIAEVSFREYEITFSQELAERITGQALSQDAQIFYWKRNGTDIGAGSVCLDHHLGDLKATTERNILAYLLCILPHCWPLLQDIRDESGTYHGSVLVCHPPNWEVLEAFLEQSMLDEEGQIRSTLNKMDTGAAFFTNWIRIRDHRASPILIRENKYRISALYSDSTFESAVRTLSCMKNRTESDSAAYVELQERLKDTQLYLEYKKESIRTILLAPRSCTPHSPSTVETELERLQGTHSRLHHVSVDDLCQESAQVALLNLLFVSRDKPLSNSSEFPSVLERINNDNLSIALTLKGLKLKHRKLTHQKLVKLKSPKGRKLLNMWLRSRRSTTGENLSVYLN